MDARKAAGVDANVLRLLYSVLLCVSVEANVPVTEMCITRFYQFHHPLHY